MLSPDKVPQSHNSWDDGNEIGQTVDIEKLMAIARRQWRVVAVSIVLALAVGMAYVMTSVPLYTATASLLIDRGNNGLLNKLTMDDLQTDDEGSILSQVEVLKSETIGLAVVDSLKLADDPVFMAESASLVASVRSAVAGALNVGNWFVSPKVDANLGEKRRRSALGKVLSGMSISRVGRSYILTVSYTSPSPDLSARIAGAIADAYLVDKLNSKYDATRRASDWLQARIEELKEKALETDLAVQKFRADNGLLNTGANGQLITDQQLSELNSALIVAQAETAKARAKYERIQQIVANGQSDAIVTDVLDSSVSNELRQKYLAASKLEAEISGRLGENHIRAVQLRSEMAEYRRLMFEELTRIAESYKSEFDVAQSREKDLLSSLDKAKNNSATAGETGVQLRELERSAETYKNLYQTFLQRYQEAIQQQSFPVTEARVITRPEAPAYPTHPKKTIVLAIFFIFGTAIGSGFGAFREFRDRFFRTGEQVRDETQLELLGLAPTIKPSAFRKSDSEPEPHPRAIRRTNSVSDYAVQHPMSAFAETLRSAKIAVDFGPQNNGAKVIGVASTLPGEGKSTISINLAELLAMQGARTLLIDCDLRNPGATRALARHAENGLVEALTEKTGVKDLLLLSEKTKLAFLPAIVKRRIPHSSDLLASDAMRELLDAARANFDYIVLDLPPLAPVVDARAISSRIDDFIFVIEWGKTSRKVVRSTLQSNPEIASKCVGVILNKVDTEKMKLYRSYGSSEYYSSRYTSYYRED